MKFSVNKSVFLNMLTPAMGTVAGKNLITAIEGVLIETMEDGTVRMSTYDMDKGVRATFEPTVIEEEGRFIINAARLYQTVKLLPEGEMTLEVNEKLNCIISCGTSNFSMFAIRGEDFPNLPDLISDRGFEISSAKLRGVIGKVSHSISAQDMRVMFRGAFFKIREGVMEVVSCDNFTLSKCTVACDIKRMREGDNLDFSFIIPGPALAEMVKILPASEDFEATIYITRKHAIIKCDDIVFFTRTIDSEYIDYNKILPKDNNITVTVDRERFLSGLERANLIADEKVQGSGKSHVKIKIEGDTVGISSTSLNGKVNDEFECVHEGEDIEIAFNCRYLINSVRVAEGEKIIIRFKKNKNVNHAILIEPFERSEDFDYTYMILPLKINE